MYDLFYHRTLAERETHRRITLCVAAYAYEIADKPIMPDQEYDKLANSVNLSVSTSRPDLDVWFRTNFQPHTGQWIYNHPQLERIGELYETHYKSAG